MHCGTCGVHHRTDAIPDRALKVGLLAAKQDLQDSDPTIGDILSPSATRPLVRELGFANVAIGLIGLCSVVSPSWRAAAALSGGVFYTLADLQHAQQPGRNTLRNLAMLSDLWAGVVLLGTFIPLLAR